MTDTNQKLREALSELIEAYNRAGPGLSRAERAVDRMRLIAAHEALALPTADHIPDAGEMVVDHLPDAGKMINGLTQAETDASASVSGLTAAPVVEREAFESYYWGDEPVNYSNPYRPESPEWIAYDAWQARAALSAGDAVDAQRYRWLRTKIYIDPKELILRIRDVFLTSGATLPEMLDAAIDAAMRKGQL